MSSKDKILWLAELMAEAKRIIDSEPDILTADTEADVVGGKTRIHLFKSDLSEFGTVSKFENREFVFINGVEIFKRL